MAKIRKTPKAISKMRYQDMYDAYLDEGNDDEFWSSINKKVGASAAVAPTVAKASKPAARPAERPATGAGTAPVRQAAKPASGEAPANRAEARRTAAQAADSRATEARKPVSKADTRSAGTTKRPVRNGEESGEVSEAVRRQRAKKQSEAKKIRKGRRIYFVFLGFWAIVLLVCGFLLWRYTDRCLVDYEKSQVENNIERLRQEFAVAAKEGKVDKWFAQEIAALPGEFEDADIIKKEYLKKLSDAKEFTCRKSKNSYGTTNPLYDILADGEEVAVMKLEAYNPRSILKILTICDWRIEEVMPIISASTSSYTFKVPADYKITVNGKELTEEKILSHTTLDKDLKLLADYVTIPTNVTYRVEKLLHKPEVTITDANGNPVEFTADEKGNVDIQYAPAKPAEIPADRRARIEEATKKWSDFMTSDLKGSNHGLAEMRSYIVKGTYLYDKAKEWATGIDITFISLHDVNNNWLEKYEISDYTEYTENCFSVHVNMLKHLKLTKTGEDIKNVTNSVFYFIYTDDTDDGKDNPKWLLLEIISVASEGGNEGSDAGNNGNNTGNGSN